MQYHIWAEMLSGGIHKSQGDPPVHSAMFMRTGGTHKKSSRSGPAIIPHSTLGTPSGNSPAKVIDNRSKCYKQLGELNNLKQAGLLSDNEYASERETVMNILNKLGTSKVDSMIL